MSSRTTKDCARPQSSCERSSGRLTRREQKVDLKEKKYTPYGTAVMTTLMRVYRCILGYINHRLLKIKSMFWKSGGFISDHDQQFMSDNEKTFYMEYRKSIFAYQNSFPIDLDLFKDMEPPKDLKIEIRVLEDCGEIVTSSGEVLTLEKGVSLLVRRCDVEHLIKQNMVIQTR